ncbi:hypothetical protein [Nonomuraea endophytica]|uniref:hypothetical protein n=1 Tax=Nonomuraea endophytica TaxID=714136 RepID=UPI0037C93BDA
MDEPAGSATDTIVATCREAMEYTFAEQFEHWRRLVGSSLRDRDVEFRLAEIAWVSAMHQTTYSHSMASATRALLQQAPITAVVDALGVVDVEGLAKLWRPWAAGQSILFVQGFGVVSPQDCARVGRLLAAEQL